MASLGRLNMALHFRESGWRRGQGKGREGEILTPFAYLVSFWRYTHVLQTVGGAGSGVLAIGDVVSAFRANKKPTNWWGSKTPLH